MSAKEVFEKYKTEINTHNFDRLAPLISEDCRFWFSSGTFEGLEKTRQAFEKTWSLIQDEVYSISNIHWLAESADAAVCIYTFHWIGKVDGRQREGTGRGTSCFKRESTGWKVIHEHLSSFPIT
jgi:ketosteroid isomerase-like protein